MSVIDARNENSAATDDIRRGQADLTQAADRAGAIVSEQIRAMLEAAERRAEEIRSSAEKDARELRQGAAREAGTLFEKLEALEAPLDALVSSLRGELDSLSTEFRRHWPDDEVITRDGGNGADPAGQTQASPEQEAFTGEPEPAAEEEPEVGETPEEPEAEVEEPVAEEPVADEPQAEAEPVDEPEAEDAEEPEAVEEHVHEHEHDTQVTQASDAVVPPAPEAAQPYQPEPTSKKGPLGWLKRRKSALFITTPGQCAVCYRSYAAGSEEALAESGWKVSGELGLCPDCQNDGWQLPEGARLPYRRAAG